MNRLSIVVVVGMLVISSACMHKTKPADVLPSHAPAASGTRESVNATLTWSECIKMKGSVIEQTYPEVCAASDGRKAVKPQ